MKHPLPLILATVALAPCLSAQLLPPLSGTTPTAAGVYYTENKGQVRDLSNRPRADVLYGAQAGPLSLHIRKTGVSYQLWQVDSYTRVTPAAKKDNVVKCAARSRIYRVDLEWMGCNPQPRCESEHPLPGYNNYYNSKNGLHAEGVKTYGGVWLRDLYKGVDLHYYARDGQHKYDFVVAPGANYRQIVFTIRGAELQQQADGSLLLKTPLGVIEEGRPLVYQGQRRLMARWRVQNNRLGFEVQDYDPTQELVIDPLTRTWATYYGASNAGGNTGGEFIITTCVENPQNSASDVFIAGSSCSPNAGTLIATAGTHQQNYVVGTDLWDAFVAKFNAAGTRLWGTYFGDTGLDYAQDCAVDASGQVHLCGYTTSTSNIATTGAHQSSFGGGLVWDAFLSKFNSNGTLQWATYYGGLGLEEGAGCAIDLLGNVYLTGRTTTQGGQIIATSAAHQTLYGGGIRDAFLVKFNAAGVRQWGTYYGGADQDWAWKCSVDPSNNVYFTGGTESTTGIASPAAHQTTAGGASDAYLAKFSPSGTRLWATYLGHVGSEFGNHSASDSRKCVYLVGKSSSTTSIATPSAHQPNLANALTSDAFVVKFDSNGVRKWGTYLGAMGSEEFVKCDVDNYDHLLATGTTEGDLPGSTSIASAAAFQPNHAGSQNDAMLVKFDSTGVRVWGTYYGGSDEDWGHSVCHAGNKIYLAGQTTSQGTGNYAIATTNGFQTVNMGDTDGYLVQFSDCAPLTPSASVNSPLCAGQPALFNGTCALSTGVSYSWSGPANFTAAVANPSIVTTVTLHSGVYTLSTTYDQTCTTTKTVALQVNAVPTLTTSAQNSSLCAGASTTLSCQGAGSYSWAQGASLLSQSATVAISPASTSTYAVTGATNGCAASASLTVTVHPLPQLAPTANPTFICVGQNATLSCQGAASYTWAPGSTTGSLAVVSPAQSITYSISGTSAHSCSSFTTLALTVSKCTGADELQVGFGNLQVFPIPFSSELHVQLQAGHLALFSELGQLVLSAEINGTAALQTTGLAKGVYLLKVYSKQGAPAKVLKVVKN